jgi:predicted TIM-barrel fold metal-dependent hydrolase
MILNHPEERVLLGTDSPWTPQAETVKRLRALGLGGEREAKILGANALHLLGLT